MYFNRFLKTRAALHNINVFPFQADSSVERKAIHIALNKEIDGVKQCTARQL
jgi:hypothetical protein